MGSKDIPAYILSKSTAFHDINTAPDRATQVMVCPSGCDVGGDTDLPTFYLFVQIVFVNVLVLVHHCHGIFHIVPVRHLIDCVRFVVWIWNAADEVRLAVQGALAFPCGKVSTPLPSK